MTKRECERLEPGDRFRVRFCDWWIEYVVTSVGSTGFSVENDIGAQMRFHFKHWWLSGSSAFMRRAKRV